MDINEKIDLIEQRNSRVELDKAWETSWTRRLVISILTYIVAIIWLYMIGESNFGLKALVPVAGYMLSTLSLPFFKQIWAVRQN